jgi:ubiquinone/menaquinone biosynthesis C-methylase UbiE
MMGMAGTTQRLAPGIPADYYRRIRRFEDRHFWYRGMRRITGALLDGELSRPGARLLDAGCGTGGFLRWALDNGSFASAAGIDIGSDAIDLARTHVPEADLRTSALNSLPFGNEAFDLIVTNDVLQHVPEDEVAASLGELYRVLVSGGTLLVHTNGSRRLRRERHDWRAYDRATLASVLEAAGFRCERVTYANTVLSLWGRLRGRIPHAPSESQDGIPQREPAAIVSAVGTRLLAAEARWLANRRATLPYGHTLFALACKPGRNETPLRADRV